jgi:hypothetical protein
MTSKTFLSVSVLALTLTAALPAQAPANSVTLPAGAWVSVRVNQPLSSDRNQAGDTFSATLTQPLIANGMVIARRGQTVFGRVAETSKGGRIKGTSRLGIEIIEISLVDGQNIPVRTQLVESTAGSSKGRDASAVATTTGVGAAIGAAAAGGSGAGLGAIAGAGASLIGVLASKGRATEIYPEDLVNFRTLAPVQIETEQAAHAFQPVRQEDYSPTQLQPRVTRQTAYMGPSPFFFDPFWGPGMGLGYGYGYGWGPRIGFYGRPGMFMGGRGFSRRR